jgi:hypothetical protein
MKGEWGGRVGRRGRRRLLRSCLGLWLLLGMRGSLGSIQYALNNEVVCWQWSQYIPWRRGFEIR